MNNSEKFKEIFGFCPNTKECIAPETVCVVNNQNCHQCPFNKFWENEYKECFDMKEDFDQ